jgi:hypothetical protein
MEPGKHPPERPEADEENASPEHPLQDPSVQLMIAKIRTERRQKAQKARAPWHKMAQKCIGLFR